MVSGRAGVGEETYGSQRKSRERVRPMTSAYRSMLVRTGTMVSMRSCFLSRPISGPSSKPRSTISIFITSRPTAFTSPSTNS